MKKFDIKWLLILVLVVILAFGLVACNKGGGGDTPDEEEEEKSTEPNRSTPQEFFGALWESSKSLGSTEVNPNEDKIHIGMKMDLSLTSDQVSELDVGIEFGLVADLKSMNKTSGASLGDSALMLKAFDKVTGDNWITLWYFLTDQDKLYFQVQDKSFEVAFDAYWNEEFATLLQGVLEMPIDFLHVDNLLTLINGIASTGGSDWTLDTLILGKGDFKGILAAFGLDIGGILQNDMVKKIMPKNVDTSSIGSILQGLGGVVVDSASCKKYPQTDGSTKYVAGNLSKTAKGIINPMTDSLFDAINALSLSFNVTSKGDIDGLTIAISGKKALINTEIKINITELVIEKTTDTKNSLGAKNKAFSQYANISWEGCMDASAWNVVLDPDLNPDTANIKIGKVLVKLDATIDLVGDYDHNKTAAQLTITNDITATNDNDAEKVLTAVYKNHTLTLETDLKSANNKAIAVEALSPLVDLIKDAAAAGSDVTVPYAIFASMAEEVRNDMFGGVAKPTVANVNPNFTSIVVTGVDIKTLATGAFYAIFSDFATGAGDEKPGKVVNDLTTYDGSTYKYGGKEYEKGQYAWTLNIKDTVATVLKAINYAGKVDEKEEDYSIDLTNIASTLLGIFKDTEVAPTEGKATPVTKPSSVDEMMALFMCTNDGILLDMTKHGLLPLYQNGVGIVNKYIGATTAGNKITLADAIASEDGYYAISGKMITKENAKKIWTLLTYQGTTDPTFTLTGITTGAYYDADGTKEHLVDYVKNSTIGWFMKFINGTGLVSGKNASNVVGDLTADGTSGLSITLNRKTGAMSCDVKLGGQSTTGYIKYTISGVDAAHAYNPDADLVAPDYDPSEDATKYVEVTLDDDTFYPLFKAQFGMGDNTDVEVGHGVNKDIYILASDATFVPDEEEPTKKGQFTSITYLKAALIRTNATDGYALVTTAGIITENITVNTATAGQITIGGTAAGDFAGTYVIKGITYLILDKQ